MSDAAFGSLTWVVPLPVLIPLFSAGIALVLNRKPRLQQSVTVGALVVATGFGVVLVVGSFGEPLILDLGSWTAPIGVTLVADRLAALMLLVSQLVSLAVLLYAVAENVSDPVPTAPVAIFYPSFLILAAGVSNAFLTGDLFNLYVGIEILLVSSFVLITLGGTRGRIRAGAVYVVISLVSSTVLLTGVAWIYGATGTVNMAQLSQRLAELPSSTTAAMQLILLVAFGVKAAIFPLGAWLPDSYPTAPAPVTAVFAGLLTKVGVYAIIRVQFVLFPGGRFAALLGVIGIVTMVLGMLGAVAQDESKRLLSFTLVSHIGFMIWGVSLGTVSGLAGAIYYAAHHIIVQTALFLLAGLIERKSGTTSLTKLSDMVRRAPIIAAMFFISVFNLVGVPPLTGFIGKLGLVEASVRVGTPMAWCMLSFGLGASFLTLYVAVKFWNKAFWQPSRTEYEDVELPKPGQRISGRQERRLRQLKAGPRRKRAVVIVEASKTEVERGRGESNPLMYVTVGGLVVVQVVMAIFSGPIYEYASQSARFLSIFGAYSDAVLGPREGAGSSYEESLPPVRPPWVVEDSPVQPEIEEELPDVGGH